MKKQLAPGLYLLLGSVLFWACARQETGASASNANASQNTASAQPATTNQEVYTFVEQMPSFPGGESALIAYVNKNMVYPKEARENNQEGRVMLQFTVMKDGSIRDAEVVRSVSESIDKEALRIVNSMPRWQPGKQNGQPVNVRFTMPLMFVME